MIMNTRINIYKFSISPPISNLEIGKQRRSLKATNYFNIFFRRVIHSVFIYIIRIKNMVGIISKKKRKSV